MKALKCFLGSLPFLVLVTVPGAAQQAPQPIDFAPVELRMMTFNIWIGGDLVDFGRVVEAIQVARADVVMLQEPKGMTRRLAEALGWQYAAEHMHVIARFPLIDPPGASGKYIFVQTGPGQVVAIMNVHLSSSDYGPYLIRDGASTEQVLEAERANRLPGLEAELAHVPALLEAGIPVVLGGDFNTPSHLDWTEAAVAAGLYPRVIDWPVTRAAEAAGFIDTYRAAHPDPVARPGITWTYGYPYPRLNPGETQDRIDLVLAAGAVEVLDSQIVGPAGTPDVDLPLAVYPSDHRAVVSTLRVTPGVPPLFVSADRRVVMRGDPIIARYHAPTGENADFIYLVPQGGQPRADGIYWLPPMEASFFGSVTFGTGALEPGAYDLVLVDGTGAEAARTTVWVLDPAARPTIRTERDTYAPGEPITVSWTNAPGIRYDWIGVYAAGDGDLYNNYIGVAYIDALPNGTLTLTPDYFYVERLEPGEYVVRLQRDDSDQVLAEATFRVVE
ncbi:MAG: endonuclease/exonuclease/phosphatase family protein [Anaerolinea sp.]|nr:endonuclease/exonuclease/phosphatase family protein [Anaerolinea sp.]